MGAVRDAVLLLFISDDPAVVVRKEASKTRKSRVVPLVDHETSVNTGYTKALQGKRKYAFTSGITR